MRLALNRQHFLRLSFGAAAFAAVGGGAMAAPQWVGKIAKLRGTVSIERGADQILLKGGEPVAAGDILTTLIDSRVRIALNDGSELNLGELTQMTIAAFDFVAETKQRDGAFDLKSGLLQAITAEAAPGSSFVIRTQNAVAATRSTDWIVKAQAAETAVYVLEGKVDVGQSSGAFRSLSSAEQDKAMLLSAGHFTIVGKMALGAALAPQSSDPTKLAALKAALAYD